jgi:hypothetical protein
MVETILLSRRKTARRQTTLKSRVRRAAQISAR